MKELVFKSRNGRGSVIPYVTISHGGSIHFSVALQSLLKTKKGDFVTLADDDGDVYIAKVKTPGYLVQQSADAKQQRIQSSALVQHLIEHLDLPVSKDKKKSVQLVVEKKPKNVGVIDYFKLMTE